MIVLEDRSGGVIIPVQAQPKARRQGVVGEHAGRLKVAVTAPPDKGKANDALVDVLAEALGVKRGQVELASGATSTAKTFLVTGVSKDELARRIADLLDSGTEGSNRDSDAF
jgi:uncharacterized protein (TIGR00251 family)